MLLGAAVLAAPAAALTPVGGIQDIGVESTRPGLEDALHVGAPGVAWDPRAKRFLVTWNHRGHPEQESFTTGRFVDVDGTPVGPAFRVADGAGAELVHNDVTREFALIAGGDLVRLDGDGHVLGRDRFSGVGNPDLGAGPPSVVVDGRTGAYLVVWLQRSGPLEPLQLFSRAVRPGSGGGEPTFPVEPIPAATALDEPRNPDLAWNASGGGFVVVWRSATGMSARRLRADGDPVGDVITVSVQERRTDAAIAPLPGAPGFLVAWSAAGAEPEGQVDVFARRILPDGRVIPGDDHRITHVLSPNGVRAVAGNVSAAVAERAGEVLVVADVDRIHGIPSSVEEAFAQVVGADGSETGPDDLQLSGDVSVGDLGDKHSSLAYAPAANRYLVAWTAAVSRMEPREFTVRGRVLAAGAPVVAATAPVCAAPSAGPAGRAVTGRVALTAAQARITMRIARAALRRAQAAARWLDSGVEARDLCQGGIGAGKFRAGTVPSIGDPVTRTAPGPRPVTIAEAAPEPRRLRLDARRLALDQATARDAIALVAALERRLETGLAGGDLADGAIGVVHLVPGYRPWSVPGGPADPPTVVPRAVSSQAARRITLSATQMRINRRIALAALRRADALIDRLEDGIGPDEIRDGTLTAADLAPGVALSTAP